MDPHAVNIALFVDILSLVPFASFHPRFPLPVTTPSSSMLLA